MRLYIKRQLYSAECKQIKLGWRYCSHHVSYLCRYRGRYVQCPLCRYLVLQHHQHLDTLLPWQLFHLAASVDGMRQWVEHTEMFPQIVNHDPADRQRHWLRLIQRVVYDLTRSEYDRIICHQGFIKQHHESGGVLVVRIKRSSKYCNKTLECTFACSYEQALAHEHSEDIRITNDKTKISVINVLDSLLLKKDVKMYLSTFKISPKNTDKNCNTRTRLSVWDSFPL